MKILVFADSHRNTNRMLGAIIDHSPDLVLHLGDHDRDCDEIRSMFPELYLRNVRGNCDFGSFGPDTDEFVFAGKRFFMTHGHKHRVKSGRYELLREASVRGADIVLYGHTHIPYYGVEDKMTVINPGSIGYEGYYGLLTIENGKITYKSLS